MGDKHEKYRKITISLPPNVAEAAKEYGQNSGRTLSGLIRYCLQKEMEKGETDATQSP
ncbi:MAG: hypothetical protein V1776_03855 [Candidatus Diapherotrites archaeon]